MEENKAAIPNEDVDEQTEAGEVQQVEEKQLSDRQALYKKISERDRQESEVVAEEDEEKPVEVPGDKDVTEGDDPLVAIKVNGKDMMVPSSKIKDAGIRALQKESAADSKLEAASLREREIERKQQELARKEQELLKFQADLQKNPPKSKEDIAEAEKLLEDILTDGDYAKEYFTGLNQSGKQLRQQVDSLTTEITNLRTEQQREKMIALQREVSAAQAMFAENYQDIFEDEKLRRFANVISGEIRAAEPSLSIAENLRRTGEEMRKVLGVKEQPKPVKGKTPPRAASARKPGPPVRETKSAADKISEMIKNRSVR